MAHAKGRAIVTVAQRAVLEGLVRAYMTPQHIAQRARIVLMSADGKHNIDQAAELGVDAQRIHRWRTGWADALGRRAGRRRGERGESAYVADLVYALLRDGQRAGRKPRFTAEQVAQIIAVACERPARESERPVTHWTPKELAAEVIKRGIVVTISPRHIARFLEEADLKPHLSRYWLNANAKAKDTDPEGLRARRHHGL